MEVWQLATSLLYEGHYLKLGGLQSSGNDCFFFMLCYLSATIADYGLPIVCEDFSGTHMELRG